MADHLEIKISVVPIEELAQEAGLATSSILASEVATVLGGSGDSVDLTNFAGSLANQGFKDGAVGYFDTVTGDGTVPTDITGLQDYDAIFIKNTGYKYSSATALGAVTTDYVLVAIEEIAWVSSSQGGYSNSSDAGKIHYYEVAWLKPGQATILSVGASKNSMSKMGANASDLTPLDASGSSVGTAHVVVKTFQSDGSEATDGNAIEFLCVT